MTINTTFMNSLLQHQFRTNSKMMQLMMYNDAVFLYILEFQSLLTTMKEIASTQAILLQENKEIRAQLNDMQEKQTQKLKNSKEKVIIPDQIRVNLHL